MYDLKEVVKVRVYNQTTKAMVLRKFIVDKDLDIQRKLSNVTFVEIRPDSYALYYIGSKMAKTDGFCSIPAYLFGEDYRYSRQSGDPRNLKKENYDKVNLKKAVL